MVGTIPDGQLSTSKVGTHVRYMLARPEHDAAIRQLLRDTPTPGAISLSFEREPTYFTRRPFIGTREDTILAFLGNRLVCMGRCTVRDGWIHGEAKRIGYLGELRLDRSVQGRFDILRDGYRFFEQLQRNNQADFYFTSIAADNERARRLLERGIRGLPRYEFLSEFVTCVLPSRQRRLSWIKPLATKARGRSPSSDQLVLRSATNDRVPEIVRFLNTHAARYQLATKWTAEQLLDLARLHLPLSDVQLAEIDGRLVACAALWDQRSFRQTVVRGYARPLRAARPALNFVARVLGRGELPPIGTPVPHAYVSPLATAADASFALPALIASLATKASQRGIRFLTLGFEANDPRLESVRQTFAPREYRTRLYRVRWPEDATEDCTPTAGPFMPELAFL